MLKQAGMFFQHICFKDAAGSSRILFWMTEALISETLSRQKIWNRQHRNRENRKNVSNLIQSVVVWLKIRPKGGSPTYQQDVIWGRNMHSLNTPGGQNFARSRPNSLRHQRQRLNRWLDYTNLASFPPKRKPCNYSVSSAARSSQ